MVVAGGHRSFPVGALLHLAVAEHNERAVVDASQTGSQGTADRDRESVPQWSGVGLDTRDLYPVWMSVERGKRCREGVKFGEWNEAAVSQRGVQGSGAVAFAEDEPVTFFGQRVPWIDGEDGAVKRGEDVGDREVATDVAEFRAADHRQIGKPHLSGQLADRGNFARGLAGMSIPHSDELGGSHRVNA